MDTIKFEKRNSLAVAHRGVSGLEKENTNAAFVAAGSRSYYGIETDVRKTADGKVVVVHDGDLKRVAGEDIQVETSTLATLQSIVLFDKDNTKNRVDLRLPTLENYISICKKYGKHCVLELKSHFTEEETAAYLQTIQEMDYLDQVTFISFHYENLEKIRAIYPTQSVQFLFKDYTDELIEKLVADKMDVDIAHTSLTKELLDCFHSLGLKVNCWTVDDPARGEELAEWGVDYITSNILE